jgi:hypothetical protein
LARRGLHRIVQFPGRHFAHFLEGAYVQAGTEGTPGSGDNEHLQAVIPGYFLYCLPD